MVGDRLQWIVSHLASADEGGRPLRLCEMCRDLLAVSGAGVMLMSGDLPAGSLCTTDAVSALIEDLQYALGEGPCLDAYRQDRVVSEPDLISPHVARWPAFTPKALDAGVRAIFGFPLGVGGVRLGALNLYKDEMGPLGDEQHADALVLAALIAQWVLARQAEAPPGALAKELEIDANLNAAIHNAAGVVSVQLEVSLTEALIRLRAYAFANERLLRDVAQDVIDGKLRLA